MILAGGIARPARAQVTASVSGRVEDVSRVAVAGAVVIVTSLETGASRVVTTDAAGTYRLLLLPAGRYDVKAEAPGFKSTVQGGFQPAVALPRVHSGNWTEWAG